VVHYLRTECQAHTESEWNIQLSPKYRQLTTVKESYNFISSKLTNPLKRITSSVTSFLCLEEGGNMFPPKWKL